MDRELTRLNDYLNDATSKGALLIPLFNQCQMSRIGHNLLFTVIDEMLVMRHETHSGGVLPDDSLLLVAQDDLPLVAVPSGMGPLPRS